MNKYNPTDIRPCEYRCLIRLTDVQEKTEGGIFLPESTREKEAAAMQQGILCAVGGNAFEEWKGRKPKPGDAVIIAMYAGERIRGLLDTSYRIVNDRDVVAVKEK